MQPRKKYNCLLKSSLHATNANPFISCVFYVLQRSSSSYSHRHNIYDDIPLLRLENAVYHETRQKEGIGEERKGEGKQRDLQDPPPPPPLLYSVLPFMNYEIIPNVAPRISRSRIKVEIFLLPQLRFIKSCAR